MAYTALYNKWRPLFFEDVVGQQHITKTLQKAIETDKVAHAYLFSGPRGTGKTSTARIFSKAINCVHGPTIRPCNECDVCRHITAGESIDVVEIDAASNGSVDDIRMLRETVKFMPTEGHKKIYIIDEVHMLTREAFNALLKTLEEPPAHVIFIMATTEPEKIPMTILSRCQRYEFRRITSQDIANRVLYIAEQEHIDITKGAAHILAVQADGGMRDALSLLDQCVSNASGTIDEELIRNLLGLIGRDWLFSLAAAVFEGRGDVIIKAVDDVIRMGKEPRIILTELAAHLRAIMLYQADPSSDTLAAYADSLDRLADQAKAATPEKVFAILSLLQQALLTARTSPTPRIAVEMGLLMASRATGTAAGTGSTGTAVQASAIPQSLVDRITRLEAVLGSGTPESRPTPAPVPVPVSTPTSRPVASPSIHVEETIPETIPIAGTTPAPKVTNGNAQYDDVWASVCAQLEQQGKKAILSCINKGHVVYIGDNKVVVSFKTPFMVTRANKDDYRQCVDTALVQSVGPGYHMEGYLEGDATLAEYEKKNSKTVETTPIEKTPTGPHQVMLEELPEAEQKKLDPLLKVLGECHIYVENK